MRGSFGRFVVRILAVILLQLFDGGQCQDVSGYNNYSKQNVESLIRDFQLLSFPPTSLNVSSNVSRQCVEDSLFLAEHLVVNITDRWAWKSKSSKTHF